jgi:type II secretory pathway pseudopilin PulG
MKKQNTLTWFTLIEILISLTLLSIILVSVMLIYTNSIRISSRSEVNRMLQENVKNVIETLAEDIRKNGILWVSSDATDTCNSTLQWWTLYKEWDKLCTKNMNEYYLAHDIGWSLIRVSDIEDCDDIKEQCIIVKDWYPLTNSMAWVTHLKFYLSQDYVPKVTVSISMKPSLKSTWAAFIQENQIEIQTSISERPF